MKFCPNCGEKVEAGLKFCGSCGSELTASKKEVSKKGNGKAIASMVLGIIAVSCAFISLFSIGNIEDSLIPLLESTTLSEGAAKFAFGIGFNLLSLPCGIIGLCLGAAAKKNGKAIAGIITSSVALLVSIIAYIVIFSV